jgi:hypothetical protein
MRRRPSLEPTKPQTNVTIEGIVEKAGEELLEMYRRQFDANPGMKATAIVTPRDPMALWFTHVLIARTKTLIAETRTLKWLTVVLTVLTAVLAGLTLKLALR